jgi:hypothetical protein
VACGNQATNGLILLRNIVNLIPVSLAVAACAVCPVTPPLAAQTPGLVESAFANEFKAAKDTSHPMRYRMRKSSPRLTTTKEMIETEDGSVAMLVAVNDKPLSPDDLEKEQGRLQTLLTDPSKQRHRKQSEAEDTTRALKVLRVLPRAFLYADAGPVTTGTGAAEKFTFVPNPKFNPPDMETQALTALTGELLIDTAQTRVIHLEGHLQQDVDFGWGILGRLSKGGWIIIDQAQVGEGVWRVVKFQMQMTGRLLIRTRNFDTTEEQSNFSSVPAGLAYQQGISMLRNPSPPSVTPVDR